METGPVWPRWILLLLFWTFVTELVAGLGDLDAGPKHHVLRMLESAAVMSMIAVFVNRPREVWILLATAVLATALTTLQRKTLEGAHDIAFSAAPLACLTLGVALQASLPWLILGLLASLGLALISIVTANRGANVGMLVGLVAVLTFGIGRIRTLVGTTVILVLVGFAAFQSPLRPRIEEWIENGWETTTLASRVDFWKATIDLRLSRNYLESVLDVAARKCHAIWS